MLFEGTVYGEPSLQETIHKERNESLAGASRFSSVFRGKRFDALDSDMSDLAPSTRVHHLAPSNMSDADKLDLEASKGR